MQRRVTDDKKLALVPRLHRTPNFPAADAFKDGLKFYEEYVIKNRFEGKDCYGVRVILRVNPYTTTTRLSAVQLAEKVKIHHKKKLEGRLGEKKRENERNLDENSQFPQGKILKVGNFLLRGFYALNMSNFFIQFSKRSNLFNFLKLNGINNSFLLLARQNDGLFGIKSTCVTSLQLPKDGSQCRSGDILSIGSGLLGKCLFSVDSN